jgi:hypothetical protein
LAADRTLQRLAHFSLAGNDFGVGLIGSRQLKIDRSTNRRIHPSWIPPRGA